MNVSSCAIWCSVKSTSHSACVILLAHPQLLPFTCCRYTWKWGQWDQQPISNVKMAKMVVCKIMVTSIVSTRKYRFYISLERGFLVSNCHPSRKLLHRNPHHCVSVLGFFRKRSFRQKVPFKPAWGSEFGLRYLLRFPKLSGGLIVRRMGP